MRETRVAVIGFGLAGSVFHAPLIHAQPDMRVTSIVTGNHVRQEQARLAYPGVVLFERVEQLWRHASDHDLVVIATPPETHLPLAKEAFAHGLAVVVDKPFAVDLAQAEELVAAAESSGARLTVFQNRRWDSDQVTLRRLLHEGSLGSVYRYESRFERWHPVLRHDKWQDTVPPTAGGGTLLDLGSHLVDQALHLFGPAELSHADVRSVRGGGADDEVFLVLRHECGVHSHLSAGQVFGAVGPRLRVLGGGGAFVVQPVDSQEHQLSAGVRPVHAAYGLEPEGKWGWLLNGDSWEPMRADRGAWPEFYAGVRTALADGAPMPVDPSDALATQRILDQARAVATA